MREEVVAALIGTLLRRKRNPILQDSENSRTHGPSRLAMGRVSRPAEHFAPVADRLLSRTARRNRSACHPAEGPCPLSHAHAHAFDGFHAREREGLVFAGRRGMLKAGLTGLAGLTLPNLLRARAETTEAHGTVKNPTALNGKSVILLWMAGGPSHIDTWDPKPERPPENRGPFATIPTRLSGVRICEHLPKQADLLYHFTIIRSVDARNSNHEPNRV